MEILVFCHHAYQGMGLVDDESENQLDELEETAFVEVKVAFFVEMVP